MSKPQIVTAPLAFVDGAMSRDVEIGIDAEGRFADPATLPDPRRVELTQCVLLPGFINAHSHAFQRGLRGLGERFPSGAGSFWTWREAMYGLVERMDESLIYTLSRRAFEEMLDAGITTVGEFHYLHHGGADRDFACDRAVLRAAADAGIRIVLLLAAYRTGGFEQPLGGGQRRFDTVSSARFLEQLDALSEAVDPATQTLGVVAHSVRAVPIDEIVELYDESRRRHLPFHMHVEEQPAEIEACLAAHGRTPLGLLNERLDIGPSFTAVHLTHSAETDLDPFLEAGGRACLCPLTEANLGDGLAAVHRMLDRGHVCLGTDSNARISMLEEARWLEYGQRLLGQRRGVCRDHQGRVDTVLLETATVEGARSLGLRAGRISRGCLADLLAIDLQSPELAGIDAEHLMEALLLGCGNRTVASVCVGGRWRAAAAT